MSYPRLRVKGLLLGIASIWIAACGGNTTSDSAVDSGTKQDASTLTPDVGPDVVPPPPDVLLETGPNLRVPKKHRASATTCDGVRPDTVPDVPDSGFAPISCRTHADCTAGKNGRCGGNGHDGWNCTYDQCTVDADCSGKVCECSGGFRSDNDICLSVGNCRVDSDCGAGGYCSPTLGSCGHYTGTTGYYCHTPKDECVDDADCLMLDAGVPWATPYCAYQPTVGRWTCSTSECAG